MSTYFSDDTLTLHVGDAREVLATMDAGSVNCCVTSPPYFGLRDYEGNPGQIGLEDSPAGYVARLVEVFTEVHRVLAVDGTLWLNLGDSYSGSWGNQGRKPERGSQRPINAPMFQPVHDGRYGDPAASRTGVIKPGAPPAKNLFGIPWRVAFALQDAGWILRNAIAWHKPNAMPESVTDRLAARHEMLFLLSKGPKYWFDLDPIREPLAHPDALGRGIVFGGTNGGVGKVGGSARRGGGHRSVYGGTPRGRNPGDVWTIATTPLPDAHFAAFPVELPRRCIAAGCKPGGTVLDPFSGAGTTALAAQQLGHPVIGIDINASYHDIALKRMATAPLPFDEAS